jgi:hypothetical protein
LSSSFLFIGFGVIYTPLLMVIGGAITVLAMYGWALEPSVAEPTDYDPPSSPDGGTTKELTPVG